MDIWNEALAVEDYVIRCRRYLHENPELSDKEDNTVAFIIKELTAMGVSCVDVPGGGVMGFIHGGKPGKSVLLRADIDALAVQESTKNAFGMDKPVVSKIPGVSHTCGHDTHAAILLGAVKILQAHREEFAGEIVLYFERGEESGHGDYYMVKYLQDNNIHVDSAWGLHIKSFLPTGTMGLIPGGIYAGNTGFNTTIYGENALACGVAIINSLNTARMRDMNPYEKVTLSVNKLQYQDGVCVVGGTCRYYDFDKAGTPMRDAIARIIGETVAAYGCTTKAPVKRGGGTRGVINNETCYEIAKSAIAKVIGEDKIAAHDPTMGAESFSILSSYYPSFYASLGAGYPGKPLISNNHNPAFDPDEAAFKTGVAATIAYALEFLAYDEPIEFTPFVGNIDEYLEANRR